MWCDGMPCIDDFAEWCEPVLRGMNSRDMVMIDNLIMLVSKVSRKHPLIFLPDFVDDVVCGMPTREIMSKHHIASQPDYHNLVNSTIKLKGARSKGKAHSREKNLKKRGWREQYDAIMLPSALIYDLLIELYRCNLLTAAVADAILRDQYISSNNLEAAVLKSYSDVKTSVSPPRAEHAKHLHLEHNDDALCVKVRQIVSNLAAHGLITHINDNVSVPQKYSRIDDMVYKMLDNKEYGMSYQALMSSTMRELPLLRLVPGTSALDACLSSLEVKGLIVYKGSGAKYATNNRQVFTSEIYDRRMKEVKNAVVTTKVKFFGRKTTPSQFVSELIELDPGDLDDMDDQVTRMAGLVMSDAAVPQSPRDTTGLFDFMVDLSNYEFKPEQVDLMKRLDFEATSTVFHCKVLISKTVTPAVLARLRSAVPEGEQGVVFTCKDVPSAVVAKTRADRTIQVIGKRGILEWCSITPVMPCRKNSVAVVKYGDAIGKVVMVRALNYESGMATAILAPDRAEVTLPIGSLKEIGPDVHAESDEFGDMSESFFRLVCSLDKIAPGTFEDGIRDCDAPVYRNREEMMRSARPDLFDDSAHPPYPLEPESSEHDRYVLFDTGTHVKIAPIFGRTMECTCLHRANEECRTTLCRHIVAAIPAVIARESDPATAIAHVEKNLAEIKADNVRRAALAVGYALGTKHVAILQKYIRARADDA